MRRAVLIFAAAISTACASADSIALDVMFGAWALRRYVTGFDYSTRGGPLVAADFRLPGSTVAYEATFSYRGYNGIITDGSALGLENRLPVQFTGEPLRVYVAPSLGFWRFNYGVDAYPIYESSDSDFAVSLGGNLGLRVVAGGKGSYLDISYGYQGTNFTGPEGFFASRRILRAKGNIGITPHVGFGLEAGTVEEGWSFTTVTSYTIEELSTFYAGSPYILIGPSFSF